MMKRFVVLVGLVIALLMLSTVAWGVVIDPGTASISGTVSDANGPLSPAAVALFRWDEGLTDWFFAGSLGVDGAGLYTFSDLPAGTYRVAFSAPDYISVNYDGAALFDDATNIDLMPGEVRTGIDATLGPLTTDAYEDDNDILSSKPVALDVNQARSLFPAGDEDWCTFPVVAGTEYMMLTFNPADSVDTVASLYDNNFMELSYSDDANNTSFSEIRWTATYTGDAYLRVAGYDPSTVGNYFLCVAEVPPATLSGTVLAGGVPCDSATVTLYTYDEFNSVWAAGPSVGTDAKGNYTFDTVAGGTYRVGFAAADCLDQYYDGASSITDASSLNVDDGDVVTGINADLMADPDALAADSYEDDNIPSRATTLTLDVAGQSHTLFPVGDEDYFTFPVVDGETYLIETDEIFNVDTIATLYNEQGSQVGFDDDGGTQNFSKITWTANYTGDAYLCIGGYSGRATGKYKLYVTGYTPSTIEGNVTLEQAAGYYADAWLERWDDVLSTWSQCGGQSTDGEGHYSFGMLTAGSYRVHFSANGYLDQYYDHVSEASMATTITVGEGETVGGIDGSLVVDPSLGSICGTVTCDSGVLPYAQVVLFRVDGTNYWAISDVEADSDGTYRFHSLSPGTYRVGFSADGYVPEYYNDAAYVTTADDVIVGEGQTVDNVNASLAIDPTLVTISGTVTDANGPVAGALVEICDSVSDAYSNSVKAVRTNQDGSYLASGLTAGQYYVRFTADKRTTVFFNNALRAVDAQRISLQAGETTTGIDARLDMETTGPEVKTYVHGNNTNNVMVLLSAQDVCPGVSTLQYSIDGAATQTANASSVLLTNDVPGTHVIRYYAADLYDNATTGSSSYTVSATSSTPTLPVGASTVLIMDESGSMEGSDPTNLRKQGAEIYIGMAEVGDAIGIVGFESSVRTLVPMVTIHNEADREFLKACAQQITDLGSTAMGMGMSLGFDELTSAVPTGNRLGILLSDGYHNEGPDPDPAPWAAAHIPLYTIGLGSSVDTQLLTNIATSTVATYYPAAQASDLQSIFSNIWSTVHNSTYLLNQSPQMETNETTSFPVVVDPGTPAIQFSTSWPGSTFRMIITSPGGSVITSQSPCVISYSQGDTYEVYKLADPEAGEWTVTVEAVQTAVGGEPVVVRAEEYKPTLTITPSAGAHGSISPNTPVGVTYGTASDLFTITPNGGYQIADVLVDGISVGKRTSYRFLNVTGNHTISATFSALSSGGGGGGGGGGDVAPAVNNYTITPSAGANGSIDPGSAQTVASGSDSATFTITPAAGYHIENVLVDGTSVGTQASYKFANVTANHTIQAVFAANPVVVATYTITPMAGVNGSIDPTMTSVVTSGSASATFTITPALGYHIQDVLVDGVSVGAVSVYRFTNVSANHTISAVFAPNVIVTKTSLTAPTSIRRLKTLTLRGSVSPVAAKGTVTIRKARWDGKRWVSMGSATRTLVSGKFSYAFRPLKSGKWRFTATYNGKAGVTSYSKSSSSIKYVKSL